MEKKYQIFISSTYNDLIEAREKVRDAILSMLHFPIGMEMFSAADEEQWEIIQDTIDSSDYYVLIIGQRYGSVIDSGDDAGISYTEKEFQYAKKRKIPILAFILSDDANIKKANIEDDSEKVLKLSAFKTAVASGRIVEWWKTPDELAQKVTAALHKQMDRKKRPGWVRGDSFDIEASHAEILSLNKLIRDLQEENVYLKSRIVDRVPQLVASFTLDSADEIDKQDDSDEKEDIKNECRTHGNLVVTLDKNSVQIKLLPIYVDHYRNAYSPIDRSCVAEYLASYVSDDELRQYNEALPPQDVIDTYIEKMNMYQRIRKGGIALNLLISNDGTAKATDVRISIDFPKEFMLFNLSDIADIDEPEAPKLPDNPIKKAEKEYGKRLCPTADTLYQIAERFKYTPFMSAKLDTLRPLMTTSPFETQSLFVEGHSLTAEVHQIPHKDLCLFDGIYLVPITKGKFKIKRAMMCSEYLEPIESYIDIEVI